MASASRNVLRMTFNNASGKVATISLADPKENLSAAEIEAVMDLILAKNIFLTTGGELIAKRDAKIINTTTDDLLASV